MARDLSQFWENLVQGKDCIQEIPAERWDWREIHGNPQSDLFQTNVKWGGFIDGIAEFDPLFFKMSPAEASLTDPQQRLLMTYCWKAIEDAGYSMAELAGSQTALYVATASSGYSSLIADAAGTGQGYIATGTVSSVGPNRMSYFLDIHGPSEPIETACSSSLIAIGRAISAIRSGRCETALAGGVSLMVTPHGHVYFAKAGMLCEDGKCKTFSPNANGYVRGEGVGMFFLKKLSSAERDGDRILAVLRGYAENHGGKAQSLTAPNPKAQSELIVSALRDANVVPESLGYIEAHGTGTALGDPIELDALKMAFRAAGYGQQELAGAEGCGIASVKTNIGHLELAAGAASLAKVLLQLQSQTLVKSLHSEELNPYLKLEGSPFFVVRENQHWHAKRDSTGATLPRRAGISSFGFGGVNAHLIVEEYLRAGSRAPGPVVTARQPACIVLSALRKSDLRKQIENLYSYLCEDALIEEQLIDLAYTLQVGRDAMEYRFAVLVSSLYELEEKLERYLSDPDECTVQEGYFLGQTGDEAFSGRREEKQKVDVVDLYKQRQFPVVLEKWASGSLVDWTSLYKGKSCRRLSLPGYPLSRKKYWVAEEGVSRAQVRPPATDEYLSAPKLTLISSQDRESRFSLTLAGEEFFLRDHQVEGTRILPGVCYLEFAQKALRQVAPESAGKQLSFSSIVWIAPVGMQGGATEIEICLRSNEEGGTAAATQYHFEVSSNDPSKGRTTVHCQGNIAFVQDARAWIDPGARRLPAVESFERVDAETCYSIFRDVGISYGPSHRSLVDIRSAKVADEFLVVAELRLPEEVVRTFEDYVLHPSLLDGALQASLGFSFEKGEIDTVVPFAVQELQTFAPLRPSVRAFLRYNPPPVPGQQTRKMDIDLLAEDGSLLVAVRGFSVRRVHSGQEVSKKQLKRPLPYDSSTIVDLAQTYLKERVAEAAKLEIDEIQTQAPLEKYGVDSVMAIQLTTTLEEKFGILSKTLFYEYRTIAELAEYFVKAHRPALDAILPQIESTSASVDVNGAEDFPSQAELPAAPVHLSTDSANEDIAIIGLAGRYPGARDLGEFWTLLEQGKSGITEIPKERWDFQRYYSPEKGQQGASYSRWGGFIDGVDCFDPVFFNITPREAEFMDPQERLFLQCVYHTLEDAGYTAAALRAADSESGPSQVGVYVGVMYEEYQLFGAEELARGRPIGVPGHPASIANRVSYFFDFQGPSIALDTMCSSSLTTIYLAMQALRQGECDVAIAGGVNVSIHPNKYLTLSQTRFASSEGLCRSFGAGGDGYVPGEGVGAVLLKPLSQAIADRDNVYGVFKGAAVNHGGKTNGYTVPNPSAQRRVVEKALSQGKVRASDLQYIEAHGTGTALGDPIEIAALSQVFASDATGQQSYAIGSVKSNIGHCESAAGIAGVTKVLLQLKHKVLVPSLHSSDLNPNIDFARSPFVVQQVCETWEAPIRDGKQVARLAAVSSFGAGGSNAHVVLGEHLEDAIEKAGGQLPVVVPMSAKDLDRLLQIAARLRSFLSSDLQTDLTSVAYTLQTGREAMEERVALVAWSTAELTDLLALVEKGEFRGHSSIFQATVRNPEKALSEFQNPKEIQRTLVDLIDRGDTERYAPMIAELWVRGFALNWDLLYRQGVPKKHSLPGYPFAEERYWLPIPSSSLTSVIEQTEESNTVLASQDQSSDIALLAPNWREVSADAGVLAATTRRIVFFNEQDIETIEQLFVADPNVRLVGLPMAGENTARQYHLAAERMFKAICNRTEKERSEKLLLQLLLTRSNESPLQFEPYAGLFALLQSAAFESSNLVAQAIEYDRQSMSHFESPVLRQGSTGRFRFVANKVQSREWTEVDPTSAMVPWRPAGVYLITGGAGGLGRLFAEEIAKFSKDTVLLLTGRSKLTAELESSLASIDALVEYHQLDVRDPDRLSSFVTEILGRHKSIDGVLHSAGVLRDGLIDRKSIGDLETVLAPKVQGLVNLDQALGSVPLDFFVCFSSLAGAFGNIGQANYACANAFMDEFAEYRNQRVVDGVRFGRTLSLNWPFWEQGGMELSRENQERIRAVSGVTALRSSDGFTAFYQSLASALPQLAVVPGDVERFKSLLRPSRARAESQSASAQTTSEISKQDTISFLKQQLSELIKLPISRMHADDTFDTYGLDSVTAIQFGSQLETHFGTLSNTLLFEFTTLAELAEYFTREHTSRLMELLGVEQSKPAPKEAGQLVHQAVSPVPSVTSVDPKPELGVPRQDRARDEQGIAVIAVSGRYPGADSIEQFWDVLAAGKDCISEIPQDRWRSDDYFAADKNAPGKMYSRWGGFLSDVDKFDPLFFGISPRDAEYMDPNERLFLEEVWELLERAGYTRETLRRVYDSRIGVFAGAMYQPSHSVSSSVDTEAIASLSSFSSIANRASYFFDFQGPSIAIDTMCSSGLTSIHMACESLQRGECRMAIAGGVSVILDPKKFIGLSRTQLIGSSPSSRSFSDGDGYLPSEGVGVVLLRPLRDALSDGDTILGVLRATSVNHGGHTQGFAVPNLKAQIRLQQENFIKAGISPETVSYIESAANGSALGDSIEISALSKVYPARSQDSAQRAIGSVKSNIGHGEAVSGIAQLTKVLLQMEHQKLVPTVAIENVNPDINLASAGFRLLEELEDWPPLPVPGSNGKRMLPRRAAISSFGAGGSNAHIIVEEFLSERSASEDSFVSPPVSAAGSTELFLFSARTLAALSEIALQYSTAIEEGGFTYSAKDIAYTLQTAREEMPLRVVFLTSDMRELGQALREFRTWLQQGHTEGSKQGMRLPISVPAFFADLESNTAEMREFLSGEAGSALVSVLIEQRELEKIAWHWVQGGEVPWIRLHCDSQGVGAPKKVLLPSYPMERLRSALEPISEKMPQNGRRDLRQTIASLVEQSLRIDVAQIKGNKPLSEYGMDSISGLRLLRDIESSSGVALQARDLATNPTLDSLVQTVQSREGSVEPAGESEILEGGASKSSTPLPEQFSLTEGQKGIWLIQRQNPQSTAYNVPIAMKIAGADAASIQSACQDVVDRYPVLAARIIEQDGIPEGILEKNGAHYEMRFESEHCLANEDLKILDELRRKAAVPISLEQGPLMRVHLFDIAEASETQKEHVILFVIHHVVFDGLSSLLLLESFREACEERILGRPRPQVVAERSYRIQAAWETELLSGTVGEAARSYWTKKLDGEISVPKLPLQKPAQISASAMNSSGGATLEYLLPRESSQQVSALVERLQISRASFFLSVFSLFLSRLTNEDQVVIGVPMLGRPDRRFDKALGYFVNVIPFQSTLTATQTFSEFARTVRYQLSEAIDYSNYPLPVLLRELALSKKNLQESLSSFMFAYQNFTSSSTQVAPSLGQNLRLELIDEVRQEGDVEQLGLEIYEESETFRLHFAYLRERFEQQVVEEMLAHFLQLLHHVLENVEQPLSRYSLLSVEEQRRVLALGMSEAVDEAPLITELIDRRCAIHPHAVAIRGSSSESTSITYSELQAQVAHLCRCLFDAGVSIGDKVAVALPRSPDLLIASLACFKLGAVYVPLDPKLPDRRLAYILSDVSPKLILGSTSIVQRMSEVAPAGSDILTTEVVADIFGEVSVDVPEICFSKNTPAYIVYTSGSTGQPKGVVVSQQALATHVQTIAQKFTLEQNDVVLWFATPGVDVSLEQMLPALTRGSSVVVYQEESLSLVDFSDYLAKHHVTVVDLPPGYLSELLEYWVIENSRALPRLRLLIAGGEALPSAAVHNWRKGVVSTARLLNAYGPTETTITSVLYEFTAEDDPTAVIPIGRPLDGEQAYVVDRYGHVLPEGIPGELWIAGSGLALGYLNKPHETVERFVQTHFGADRDLGSVRCYRTGDLVRWIPGTDGLLEFLGRIDQQVQIRGHRVELGEIETVLDRHPAVREAVVVALHGESTEVVLHAFVCPNQLESLPLEEHFRQYLEAALPRFMLPRSIQIVTELPKSRSGKVDKSALEASIPLVSERRAVSDAPLSKTEQTLFSIWSELFDSKQIEVEDSFWDLGGHSLLAVRLVARIQRQFGVKLPLDSLLQYESIRQQAGVIERDRVGQQQHGILVPLANGREGTPLFCVHPVGGDVLSYSLLAESLHVPVYGLRSPMLSGGPAATSIEELSAAYIEEIRGIQASGPYQLAGWSLGGVIAYEMAQQLRAKDEEVAQLVLIDSHPPEALRALETARFIGRQPKGGKEQVQLCAFAQDVLGVVDTELFALVEECCIREREPRAQQIAALGALKKFTEARNLLSGIDLAELEEMYRIFVTHVELMDAYEPRPYPGAITLLEVDGYSNGTQNAAGGQNPAQAKQQATAWEVVSGFTVEQMRVKGDHYSILQAPAVAQIARTLRTKLLT